MTIDLNVYFGLAWLGSCCVVGLVIWLLDKLEAWALQRNWAAIGVKLRIPHRGNASTGAARHAKGSR